MATVYSAAGDKVFMDIDGDSLLAGEEFARAMDEAGFFITNNAPPHLHWSFWLCWREVR